MEDNLKNKPEENDAYLIQYHQWYYDTGIWEKTKFLGVRCMKSISDMWNYQEIICGLKPSLIVEFGTAHGGSTLFFSMIHKAICPNGRVFSVDIDHGMVPEVVRQDVHVELMTCNSTDGRVKRRIIELKKCCPGPIFAILDSDHHKDHVLDEMELLRDCLAKGDYLIVEDSNINGHPVLNGWGEGPMEAIREYFARYPDDYAHDTERERRFGWTFAPEGFLVRK